MTALRTAWVIRPADAGENPPPDLALPDFETQGREILERANAQAKQILEAAQTHYDRGAYQQGFQRGQTEGYAHGLRQAAQKTQLRLAALAQTAAKVVDELAAARQQALTDRQEQLLLFALELARRIVGEVAAVDTGAALANLRRAMELASDADEVVVFVSPAQRADLEQEGRRLWRELGRAGRVRLEGDPTIGPGGARVQTRCGAVDATIETQLQRVAQALLGRAPQPNPDMTGRYIPAADTKAHADL